MPANGLYLIAKPPVNTPSFLVTTMRHSYLSVLFPALLGLSLRPACSQTLTQVANLTLGSVSPLSVAARNNTVFVVGGDRKLSTYDMSQPTNPVLLSAIAINTEYPRTVMVASTRAYTYGVGLGNASSSTLAAFDISKLNASVSVGAKSLTIPYPAIGVTDALVCVYGRPYGGNSSVLEVYDSNLILKGSLQAVATGDNLVMSGTTVYISDVGTNDSYIHYGTIFNLANPALPVSAGSFLGNIGAISGTLAFGLQNKTLMVYDISNPLQPVLKGSVATNGGDQIVASGNRVYTTGLYPPSGTSARYLQAFDVSNPAAPVLLATASSESTASYMAANGNTAYLIDGANHTLKVYTLSGAPLAAAASRNNAQSIFPNPAHGTITVAHAAANAPVTIFDSLGKVCLQTTLPITNKLDISALPSGLYTARVSNTTYRLAVE
jgi:hypothetical protein